MFIVKHSQSTMSLYPDQPSITFLSQCPATLFSVCPQGNSYINQRTPEFLQAVLESEGIDLKKRGGIETLERWVEEYIELDVANKPMAAAFLAKEKNIENKILESLISSLSKFIAVHDLELTLEWSDYLMLLYQIPMRSLISQFNTGVCKDAALQSIKLSLQKQLKWGIRETIQLVSLVANDHAFVIYNASPLKSTQLPENANQIESWLNNLTPQDPNKPVTICDSWLDYCGVANKWYKHYKSNVVLELANGGEKAPPFVQVVDYSVPSFRKGRTQFNPGLREFFKTTLRNLLSIFDRIDSIEDFLKQPFVRQVATPIPRF